MERCPLSPEKKTAQKARVQVTEDMRQEIIRRSFELFEQWHGVSYDELVVKSAMGANAPPKGITQAALAIANEYGLSHNQRYQVLNAVGIHAWVRQEKAFGRGEYTLTWKSKQRCYDAVEI